MQALPHESARSIPASEQKHPAVQWQAPLPLSHSGPKVLGLGQPDGWFQWWRPAKSTVSLHMSPNRPGPTHPKQHRRQFGSGEDLLFASCFSRELSKLIESKWWLFSQFLNAGYESMWGHTERHLDSVSATCSPDGTSPLCACVRVCCSTEPQLKHWTWTNSSVVVLNINVWPQDKLYIKHLLHEQPGKMEHLLPRLNGLRLFVCCGSH